MINSSSNDLELLEKHKLPGNRYSTESYNSFEGDTGQAKIDLPKNQMTHVLRHTSAIHFVINAGNILTLRKILGHADIKMTMRYAHLAPDHLQDALRLNPISEQFVDETARIGFR